MRMLELFSGSGRMSETFKKKGWQILSIDLYYPADLNVDVLSLSRELILNHLGGEPDFIWASPPCTTFSIASVGKHWNPDRSPKTENAKNGIALLQKTLEIIGWFPDCKFVIENPRGMMRKMPMLSGFKCDTITYCQYRENRMKPTDLWNNLDHKFKLMCKNGMSCHEAAPRGSKTGTQGIKGAFDRGMLPLELCEEVASLW